MTLTETELTNAILDELSRHTVLTLATTGDAGPHAASLMYAHDAFDIYWLSDPKTEHSAQLAHNSSAAVTIAAQQDDFRKIHGLQIEGDARRLTNADQKSKGFDLLTARYPFLKQFAVGKLARHLGAAAVYLFRATSLTLIDNSRGFGFKQTLQLAGRLRETRDSD
jgi:uncharacterized protein YhbP (UPF0306 family)